MLSLEQAYHAIADILPRRPVEEWALADALGCVLAEPVRTDLDAPPFDRSLMDGYAVRAADLTGAPAVLRLAGQIAAGDMPTAALEPETCVQINTGAPIPEGADAVVRVEDTELVENGRAVRIAQPVPIGKFLTLRATYAAAGDVVIGAGVRLSPGSIGSAAAAGAAAVRVHSPPTFSVMPTGDELVDVSQKPTGAQIRNSNSLQLAALIRQAGYPAALLPPARDDRSQLAESLRAALAADIVCLTGGVSMGEFDFVPEVLESLGAKRIVEKLAIKPGRPIHVFQGPSGQPIFALPGNPASAFVGFHLLVLPAARAMEGQPLAPPPRIACRLEGELPAAGARRTFVPCHVRAGDDGELSAQPVSFRGSGDVFGLGRANGLIDRDVQAASAAGGSRVRVLLVDGIIAAGG